MQQITESIQKSLMILDLPKVEFGVNHPSDEKNGDYASNVALILWGNKNREYRISNIEYKSPRELAEKIVEQLNREQGISNIVERIEVAGAGFINFFLSQEYLLSELGKAREEGYGKNELLTGKKVIVEFTDPNPFKEFHIGHLMSNTIGESIARLLAAAGAEVKRANYQGDVGLHVAKSIWGMIHKSQITNSQIPNWVAEFGKKSLQERQQFMGAAYAKGATAYEEDEVAKAQIIEINKAIYGGSDQKIKELYQVGRKWSLEYFETIYQRLGTRFDEYFFESEAGPVGLEVIEEGIQKGVLEVGEGGAVVYKGEKDGLHTRVFRNALGLATYEGKELGLAKTKWERWQYDRSYIVTANEIDEYFKVLLTVMGKLYPDLAKRTTHLSHGMMRLTTGKMSSRTGKVVTGEGLLNELKEVVLGKMGARQIVSKEQVADEIAVGALKYTVLRQQIGGDIVYDPVKMTNLEGDTGPYLQYTHARARSVLRKANIQSPIPNHQTKHTDNNQKDAKQTGNLHSEEVALLRWIYRYPEVIVAAGRQYAPHLVAQYIYELATRFNTFYNKHQILPKAGEEIQVGLRLQLTQAVANVLKSGLGVLGITAPSEM